MPTSTAIKQSVNECDILKGVFSLECWVTRYCLWEHNENNKLYVVTSLCNIGDDMASTNIVTQCVAFGTATKWR